MNTFAQSVIQNLIDQNKDYNIIYKYNKFPNKP